MTTYYVYDGTMLVREMQQNAQGVLQSTATYLCGPRGPEYRRDDTQGEGTYSDSTGTHPAGKTRWYVYDGLGSVVGEVDPSGNLTSTGTFDVYGAKRQGGTGAATSRQGFVGSLGHVTDAETGLVYMRARYYDPNVGRFISEDPGRSGDNWFAYANDGPTNNVDKDGQEASYVNMLKELGGIFVALYTSKIFRGVFMAACCSLLLPELCLLNGEGLGLGGLVASGIVIGYGMAVEGCGNALAEGYKSIVAETIGFVVGYSCLLDFTMDFMDAVDNRNL